MKFLIILLSCLILQVLFNMILFSEDIAPYHPPMELQNRPTYSPFISEDFSNLTCFGYAGKAVFLLSDIDLLSMDDQEVLFNILEPAKRSIETSPLKVVNAFILNNNLTVIMSDEIISRQEQGPLEYYNYQISKP